MSAALPNLNELLDEFADLVDWDERYDYLIDLGKQIPGLPEELQSESSVVKGCMSMVWLVMEPRPDGKLSLQADSDSLIVRGLIAVLLAIFNDRPPEEILQQDEQSVFKSLGLDQNLSPQRRNGLFAMVQRIKQRAVELASQP